MGANGCVNLSTVAIKHLQGLLYWLTDCHMHQLTTSDADWTQEVMQMAMSQKEIKGMSKDDKKPSVKDMGKFNPDYFQTYNDAFKNLLAQTI